MSNFAVHAALTTPFAADASVDAAALGAHVDLLVEDGVDGLLVAGTTGEGPLLEEAELEAVIAAAVEAAADRIELIAHVGRPSTAAMLRAATAAAGAGAHAVMAVTPYYYGHDDDAILGHYRALMDAGHGLPVMAYTYPERTGNELSAEVLDRLAGEGLAGLKDSTMSPKRQAEYLEVARRHDGLRVMVGSERLALRALRGGGAGSVSALANVRADVLLRVREEGSEDAQEAVDAARAELAGLPDVKRAVSRRLADRGVTYRPEPRAPLR